LSGHSRAPSSYGRAPWRSDHPVAASCSPEQGAREVVSRGSHSRRARNCTRGGGR
jgi:hypothetical protein